MSWVKQYIIKNFTNFTFFYSVLRERIVIVILLAVLAGILDSLGLTMFLPLLQMADGSDNVDLGNLSFITDFLRFLGIKLTIIKALLILIIVFAIKGIIVYYAGIYKIQTQQILSKRIRMNIVNEFPYFPYIQFVNTDVGQIQNIFLGEIGRLQNTYNNYLSMLQGLILIVIYFAFSFIVDWKFALLVCLGGGISNLLFSRINKLTKEKSRNLSSVNNKFANMLIQYITNFKYLKATGQVLTYREKIEKSIDNVQYENYQIEALNNKVQAFREPLLIFIIAIVIGIQVWFFGSQMSAILVSLLFFYRALIGIVSIQANFNATLANQGAIDNIMGFYRNMCRIREKVGLREYNGFHNYIELQNVSFSFGNRNILNNINLKIEKNKSIAFVGESGSGKTTLINIISGLLKPTNGFIMIDGIGMESFNQFKFQKKLGYITQEATIFNDTIYNNITFWAAKTEENITKFNRAIERASIKKFIDELPKNYDTLLGNNGVNLSGGQRQRISIARELFKDVEILVLDEATSALDSGTEKEIQRNIDELKGEITIIIIAHRLSTIKNCDIIYMMDKGNIIQEGTFSELLSKSGMFSKMVSIQNLL